MNLRTQRPGNHVNKFAQMLFINDISMIIDKESLNALKNLTEKQKKAGLSG